MKLLKVIISGGGTGGHIFPAISIANEIKKNLPETEILFVGAKGRMEMEKVPSAGYEIQGLWISGLQRKLSFSNFLFPFKVILSTIKARSIIKKFKPNIVIGTGGYASGPTLRAAASLGIPTLIQEQNSYPGITNKLLSKKVNSICVAYEGMEKFFPKEKIILTGNPVREDILHITENKSIAYDFFGINPDKKTILVIGGSLGARTINESIAANLFLFKENNVQLLWQTGKTFFERAKNEIQKLEGKNCYAFDFISKMDLAYAVADIVISRAGASSVSELAVAAKPSILVPSPNVAEDHQTKNAMALVNKNAALIVKDSEAKAELVKLAIDLLQNVEKQKELSTNISKLAFKNACSEIVLKIFQLAGIKS